MKSTGRLLQLLSAVCAVALIPLAAVTDEGDLKWEEVTIDQAICPEVGYSLEVSLDARGRDDMFSNEIFLNTYRFFGFYLFLR